MAAKEVEEEKEEKGRLKEGEGGENEGGGGRKWTQGGEGSGKEKEGMYRCAGSRLPRRPSSFALCVLTSQLQEPIRPSTSHPPLPPPSPSPSGTKL